MSLNIKNPETYKLARQLSHETGESLTTAVTTALRERLEAVRRRRKSKATLAAIRAISARMAALDKGPFIDHAEMLYDDNGLPK
ncbi:MAG TPA: type II toxin-antitoxin system VapB family antitoxin [Candidatus Binatus sp.]|nr:type II toxin-antitoxin system VapB family antitoxin [Candidatus Binatus sp.]